MLEQHKTDSHRQRIAACKSERLKLERQLEKATEACAKAFAERRDMAAGFGAALGVVSPGPMPLAGQMHTHFTAADAAWLKTLCEQRDAATALLDSILMQAELEAELAKLEAKAAKAA